MFSKPSSLYNHFQCTKDNFEPEAHDKEPHTEEAEIRLLYDHAQFSTQKKSQIGIGIEIYSFKLFGMSVCGQLASVTAMSCSLPKRRIPFQKYVEYAEAKSQYFALIPPSMTGIFNTFSLIRSTHFQQTDLS